jgi:hypothetical protein
LDEEEGCNNFGALYALVHKCCDNPIQPLSNKTGPILPDKIYQCTDNKSLWSDVCSSFSVQFSADSYAGGGFDKVFWFTTQLEVDVDMIDLKGKIANNVYLCNYGIKGPGCAEPTDPFIIWDEVEETVFSGIRWCLVKNSPRSKCPDRVYACDQNAYPTCDQCIANTDPIPEEPLGTNVTWSDGSTTEAAVHCASEGQECPSCFMQFGTGTTVCYNTSRGVRCVEK